MTSVFRAIARKKLFSTEIVYEWVRIVCSQNRQQHVQCRTFLRERIRVGGMTERHNIPIYTRATVLQMISTSTPFLSKASSKHAEAIEASILPPDCALSASSDDDGLRNLHLESFRNVLYRKGFRHVQSLLESTRNRVESYAGEPRGQVFDCSKSRIGQRCP